jgi:hypothetical protein
MEAKLLGDTGSCLELLGSFEVLSVIELFLGFRSGATNLARELLAVEGSLPMVLVAV